jgi:hypothetical protein
MVTLRAAKWRAQVMSFEGKAERLTRCGLRRAGGARPLSNEADAEHPIGVTARHYHVNARLSAPAALVDSDPARLLQLRRKNPRAGPERPGEM